MLLADSTNSRISSQTGDDNKSEEAWIAKLESNKSEPKLATKNGTFKSNEEERKEEEVVTSCEIFRLFLICFSLKKNLKEISKYAHNQKSNLDSNNGMNNNNVMGDVKVIHGIRTLTIMWIIFAHTIGLVSPEMMSKYDDNFNL